jgi:anti-anti-sigma factor
MSLEIAARELEGIEILQLRGRLTFGQEDLQLRNELDRLMREKKTKVVLDLQGLREIDTTGLGTLLFVQETLQAAGGRLTLGDLQPSHIEVLMKARLEVAFEVFKDDLDAVNSFFPGREVHGYDVLEFVRSKMKNPVE